MKGQKVNNKDQSQDTPFKFDISGKIIFVAIIKFNQILLNSTFNNRKQ